MSVRVVVGAQFGDEAKGKITDYLAADARFVVRTGGGPNAGHSIHLPEGAVVLHQLSCGVLRHGVTGVSGPGMVLDPFLLEKELADLRQRGLLKGEPLISERAHVLLPLHTLEDEWEESVRSGASAGRFQLGTTRTGIGPAYADRYGRWGLRMVDLLRPSELSAALERLYASKAHVPNLPPKGELETRLAEVGGTLAPLIGPTEPRLWDAARNDESILLEGAQSALLDVDFGTYPYVTSSHPTAAGALVGSGIPPQELDEAIGVSKAYATRVGAGPFPTEDTGELGEYLRREGREHGATTGRPRRCGWLDLVLLRYAVRLNGFSSLALTKVDVLGGLEEVPVGVAYQTPSGETLTDYPPPIAADLAAVQVTYRRLPSWPEFTHRLKERIAREGGKALPTELRAFLAFVASETGVPVEWVSYGAQRDETVWMGRGSAPTRPAPIVAWTS